MSESAFFMPLLFPVGHLFEMITAKDDAKPSKSVASASADLKDHISYLVVSLRSFFISLFLIYGLYDGYGYPAFGAAETIQWSWAKRIIYRNLIATALVAGFWDWLLYFSPLKKKLSKYKLTKEYPSNKQILHDIFWTFTASVCAAGVEILMCYAWVNGIFKYKSKAIMDNAIYNICWALAIGHFRQPHFYFVHRIMHPWRITGVVDVGKFLYKWVHSLHHKSYNPTAFSGTNMHPVESTLYYSAALIFVPFQVHPSIAIGCIVSCAVDAWLGHGGFQWPGSGDYFHQLHHQHFDCNYGADKVPLDKWFGSYIACKQDLKKIWGKKANIVGRQFNETVRKVHPQ